MEGIQDDKMNKMLGELSLNIIPSDNYIKAGNELITTVFKLLQGKSTFKLGSIFIAGSAGKHTTIINSDWDSVVFVNDEEPKFDKVLLNFKEIISKDNTLRVSNMKIFDYSLQFNVKGFDIDLLPAANFVAVTELKGDDRIDEQAKKTVKKIALNPKQNSSMYSAGLAESQVRFMKKQSAFIHELVRLAKFWYKGLDIGEPIYGAKTMIELIAISAGNVEEKSAKPSYLKAFRGCLALIKDFPRLNIVFANSAPIPENIKSERPLVLEPSNPYNNLTKNWEKSPEAIKLLRTFAEETDKRFEKIKLGFGGDRRGPLDIIFEPQPKFVSLGKNITKPKTYFVEVEKNSEILHPDIHIRNHTLCKSEDMQTYLRKMQTYLQVMVEAFISHGMKSSEEIKRKIEEVVEVNIMGKEQPTGSFANQPRRNQDDYDVTLTIPVHTTVNGNYSILYNAKWN